MVSRKLLKIRIGDKVLTVGLAGAAVLLSLIGAAGNFVTNFPDRQTSLGRALRRVENNRPKSPAEYFEELKKISGLDLRNTIHRLKQKGLISGSRGKYKTTALGRVAAMVIERTIPKKEEWDGKWRIVAFDVPEKMRHDRDWLRRILKIHDYNQFQKSVFIGKYPLPEVIYKEIHSKKLGSHVRLITVGEIDNDAGMTVV